MVGVRAAIETFFSNAEQPFLFAGAGVSSRAGLPDWPTLLARLAEHVKPKDKLTALLMEEKIREKNLTKAAEYYFLTDKIVDGDKYDLLVRELSQFDETKLRNLASLPFKAIVSTNFDRSLLQAFPLGKLPLDYRYGDQSFAEALFPKDKYFARIHGAVEAPRSIVLTDTHFQKVMSEINYRNLLTHIFQRQNVMFLGFSFYDPAIKHVLEQIERDYGSAPTGRHIAFVPDGVEAEFFSKLSKLNIEIVRYAPDNHHQELWDGIDSYASRIPAPPSNGSESSQKSSEPFAMAKKFLAACYARVRLASHVVPLREAVVEGMVAGILQRNGANGIKSDALTRSLHGELGISFPEAALLVDKAIAALASDSLCKGPEMAKGGLIHWTGTLPADKTLNDSVAVLVKSVRNRAVVQEGWRSTSDVEAPLKNIFSELVLRRGWDLGAAFAANRIPSTIDIADVVRQHRGLLSIVDVERIQRICESVLARPTEEEAAILSDLGRASFALELAIQSPRTILFHAAVLPQRIYLDANVLMPAIMPGHPFHDVYRTTIDRLKEAAARATVQVQLVAFWGFLNEVVSHRRLATAIVANAGDHYLRDVSREVLYHGASNVNVFVGAYASQTIRNPKMAFPEFLQRFAPYTSEEELAAWLVGQGIAVVRQLEMLGPEYPKISLALQKSYASGLAGGKDPRLIEHDAYQLSGLAKDRAAGRRAIFVTGDRTLREIVGQSEIQELAQSMVSHVGLTQLIDLLVGMPTSSAALSGLMWFGKTSKRTELLRSYLLALGLAEYDEALAMEMPKVVEGIAERMNDALSSANVDPDSGDPAKRAEAFRIMGMYENEFFEGMRETIERRERQKGK